MKILRNTAGVVLLTLATVHAQTAAGGTDFNRFGIGLKVGESAGLAGGALSYNITKDVQVSAGYGAWSLKLTASGGTSGTTASAGIGTTSIFTLARYYWKLLYFDTGLSIKLNNAFVEVGSEKAEANATVYMLPLHVGLEFGGRTGFYFGFSGGYAVGLSGTADLKATSSGGASVSTESTQSGVSGGVAIGYYFM